MDHDETSTSLNNSGDGPLRVPGFAGVSIDYELPPESRFAHGILEWRQAPAVTARELTMVTVMNQITDLSTWQVDVFKDDPVTDWQSVAFVGYPLMSEKAWSWCVQELRDKALFFAENQYIRVLDIGSCVCKADTAALQSLGALFRKAVAPLAEHKKQQEQRKELKKEQQQLRNPKKKAKNITGKNVDARTAKISNLVDPLLFPLIYGKSLVLADGGRVDLHDIFGTYKDTTLVPKHFDKRVDSENIEEIAHLGVPSNDTEICCYWWSYSYQSLPCEVEFLNDFDTQVQITSYINNLDPAYKDLHHAIEKVISLAIRPWNDCLVRGHDSFKEHMNQGQLGRIPLRIITYGVEWDDEFPEWALAFRVPSQRRIDEYRLCRQKQQNMPESHKKDEEAWRISHVFLDVIDKEDLGLPPADSDLWQMAKSYLERPEGPGSTTPIALPDDWRSTVWDRLKKKA